MISLFFRVLTYLTAALVFWSCIFSTFNGYPFALLSFLGYLVIVFGCYVGIEAIIRPREAKSFARLLSLVLSIIFFLIGKSIIALGGVEYLGIDDFEIQVTVLGGFYGLISGIFGFGSENAKRH